MTDRPWTPGPWSACSKAECSCFTIMSEHHPVAEVANGKWGDSWPAIRLVDGEMGTKAEAYMERMDYGEIRETVARANWRLMAAAPELYEALEAMVADAERCGVGDLADQMDADVVAAARAAMAKARGE